MEQSIIFLVSCGRSFVHFPLSSQTNKRCSTPHTNNLANLRLHAGKLEGILVFSVHIPFLLCHHLSPIDFSLHHRLLCLYHRVRPLHHWLISLHHALPSRPFSWGEQSRYLRRSRKNRTKDPLNYPWRKRTTTEHKGHKDVSIPVHVWYSREEIRTKPQYIISEPHTADQRSAEKVRPHPPAVCPPEAMPRDGPKYQCWV